MFRVFLFRVISGNTRSLVESVNGLKRHAEVKTHPFR